MNQKHQRIAYANYIAGFGLGTALAPNLLKLLGGSISTSNHWKMWLIGGAIFIVGLGLEYRAKKAS